MKAPITISPGLPSEIRKRTKYSVDASIYLDVTDSNLAEQIKIEDFNPNDSNIVFRDEELQPIGNGYYLDVICALNVESPEAAEQYVIDNLKNVISVPEGLKLRSVEIGESGDPVVYDNQKQAWCYNEND